MIRWEIEPRCNLKCKHCFVADTEYGCATTSLENGLSYLNKLHELGVRTVVFSTREPLLYDGLCRLIYEAKLLDMSVAIVTNGILLDDMELSRKLVESGVDEVFVSIEGITAASNDFIRGKGTLARVIRGLSNLERCTREGKKLVRLFIQMSINQLNMAEGSDMPEFFNVLPIDGLIISAIGASGNAAKNRDIILSQESDEYIACCKTIIEKYLELKTRNYILGFKSLSPYDIVLINHEYGTNFCPYLPGCSAMNGAYSLLPSGKIIPCISLKEELPSSLMIPSILEVEAKDYSSIYVTNAIKRIFSLNENYQLARAAHERLQEYLCMPLSTDGGLTTLEILSIEYKAVGFSFGGRFQLSNINLAFRKGTLYGLCGKNGSGKTTLMLLLLGIYPNYRGEILINGINQKQYNLKKLRSCVIHYTEQTPVFFDEPMVKNFELFEGERRPFLQVKTYIQMLGLHNIVSLEDDALRFSEHYQYSAGELAKIAILRSLVLKKSVYIWDEPDTALDEAAKQALIKILKELSNEAIVVIITHNSDLLNACETIYHL